MFEESAIYYSNGTFLIYENELMSKLRESRILGNLIGCVPKNPHQVATSGLPFTLSHYAVKTTLQYLPSVPFKKLIPKEDTSLKVNETLWSKRLLELKEEARKQHVIKRTNELRQRNIEPTGSRMGSFDENKMKLTVPYLLDEDFSSFRSVLMTEDEVQATLELSSSKMALYENLYNSGFYISSGVKFGTDFLAYIGDPTKHHAKYAIRCIKSDDDKVDLTRENINELNACHRLCHTANKIATFAIVYSKQGRFDVKYWTLRPKEYLRADSSNSEFENISVSICDESDVNLKRRHSHGTRHSDKFRRRD